PNGFDHVFNQLAQLRSRVADRDVGRGIAGYVLVEKSNVAIGADQNDRDIALPLSDSIVEIDYIPGTRDAVENVQIVQRAVGPQRGGPLGIQSGEGSSQHQLSPSADGE